MQHRALQARVSVGMGCRQTLSLDGLQAEAKVRVQRRYGREHGRNMVATRLSNNTVRQRCKLGKVGMDVRRVCTCRSVIVTWLATGRTRHQIVISVPRRANIPVAASYLPSAAATDRSDRSLPDSVFLSIESLAHPTHFSDPICQ